MMTVTQGLRALTIAAALAAGTASVAYAADPMVGGAPMMASKTIVENASQAKNLTTLVAAVKAAGLVETLSGPARSRSSPRRTPRSRNCRRARSRS